MPNDGMIAMGMSDVVVDGEVIEADPPRKLVVTWRMVIDPRMAAEGKPMSTYKGGVVVA